MMRLLAVEIVMFLMIDAVNAQTGLPVNQSTVYGGMGMLQKEQSYSNGPSARESFVAGGAGFRFEHYGSRQFSFGTDFEVDGSDGVIFGTFTIDLEYALVRNDHAPGAYLECGYGVTAPSIFVTELLRLDAGTSHLGGGMTFPLADDRFLRIGLSYMRFRSYDNSSGASFSTYSAFLLTAGYTIASLH
ncbi:MAG TPA: hypothetical protein VMW43_06825 [Bacteroidota bacterium]|nr:hypothetical protein [Bacteroidota bacterium]